MHNQINQYKKIKTKVLLLITNKKKKMSSNSIPESAEINKYVKEYLQYLGLNNTLDCFDAELKSKQQ